MDALLKSRKARRSMFARQLEELRSGKMGTGTNVRGALTEQNIQRIRAEIAELDALVKELSSKMGNENPGRTGNDWG